MGVYCRMDTNASQGDHAITKSVRYRPTAENAQNDRQVAQESTGIDLCACEHKRLGMHGSRIDLKRPVCVQNKERHGGRCRRRGMW